MTAEGKRQVKAAEYRDRALEASGMAEASSLDHVREKHEVAAARWSQLAELNERPDEPAAQAAAPDASAPEELSPDLAFARAER